MKRILKSVKVAKRKNHTPQDVWIDCTNNIPIRLHLLYRKQDSRYVLEMKAIPHLITKGLFEGFKPFPNSFNVDEVVKQVDFVCPVSKISGPEEEILVEHVLRTNDDYQRLWQNTVATQQETKHGRLIDADKLKNHYAWWGQGGGSGLYQKKTFDTIVDLQPTIIESNIEVQGDEKNEKTS